MCEGIANFPFQILLVIFHSQYRNEDCRISDANCLKNGFTKIQGDFVSNLTQVLNNDILSQRIYGEKLPFKGWQKCISFFFCEKKCWLLLVHCFDLEVWHFYCFLYQCLRVNEQQPIVSSLVAL